jgi:hypothetical protein
MPDFQWSSEKTDGNNPALEYNLKVNYRQRLIFCHSCYGKRYCYERGYGLWRTA